MRMHAQSSTKKKRAEEKGWKKKSEKKRNVCRCNAYLAAHTPSSAFGRVGESEAANTAGIRALSMTQATQTTQGSAQQKEDAFFRVHETNAGIISIIFANFYSILFFIFSHAQKI